MEEIAPCAYNRGMADAQTYFLQMTGELPDICFRDGLTSWSKRERDRRA